MAELLAKDTISGQMGKAYATINGNKEELFHVKNLEAVFNKEKVEVKTLGKRGTQYKGVGYTGTGTMTIYYVSSLFRSMAVDYMENGQDVYFTLMVTNQDDSSSIGKQTVALYNCNVNSTVLAKLDTDIQVLEETLEFTFESAKILDEFSY